MTMSLRGTTILAMEYPPSDRTPPAKRAPREKLNLAKAASGALDRLRNHLSDHPGWVHSTTASVMIEFLCWHYGQERSMGGSVGFKGFRPQTKRGRPAGVNVYENFRPADQRKAAGLSKTDVRIGQEPPKG